MTAISLYDILADCGGMETDAPRAQRLSQLAAKLVDAALADWQRILEYERQFSSGDLATPGIEAQFNQSIYEIYRDWANEAEQLLKRTRSLAARGYAVANSEHLEHAHGRVSARLKLTPQMLARAAEQARNDDIVPMEELRNELRSRVRA